MCWQKNCDALAAPPGGELLARHLSGERAACVPGGADGGLDLPLREQAGAEDGTTVADSRDRANSGSLRLPKNPGAAESGRLEGGKEAGVSPLSGRRLGTAAQATPKASGRDASPRAFPAHCTEPSVESGFCGRPIGRWATVSSVDSSGYIYARKLGHRSRAEVERRRRGGCPKSDSAEERNSEAVVL